MVPGQLDIRVLGPIEVLRAGNPVPLGGHRQRALLALLVLDVQRPVAAGWLLDELWGGGAPPGESTLPSYISRLRSALDGSATIEGGAAGYRIDVAPDRVDAYRFEALVADARRSAARGKPRRARATLQEALSLWRGPAFADVRGVPAVREAADRLEGLRLQALEQRIDADLALDGGSELIDELERLVAAHPHREAFWGQLMLVLYRADRQADALAAYHRARRALDDELGVEPGASLQELQRSILNHEDVLLPRGGGGHRLPAPITTFVGREAELAELDRLLDDARLVTLTGVGGVGKTRLALEAAGRMRADFADGARFVDLSTIPATGSVARVAALALGLGEHPDGQASDALLEHLRDTRLLLLVDNCEHVRETVAQLVERLLHAAPGLTVLATSREALGVPGEVDLAVQPLSLAPSRTDGKREPTSEAVTLFLTRAREARPSLRGDERTVATAAAICADLDGLPLAIELAAARAKALSLDDIAARLDDRFRFLVSWRRLSPARHRTLREAMDWSYELLSPGEQELFARLSVFAGPFTIEAVAACADGADDTLPILERLVDASLVVAEEREGEMQYRLLDTVRRYAAEQLRTEAAEAVRRAHAAYYRQVAERADLTAVQRGSGQRLDIALGARDNLRGALAWAIDSGALQFGLELATSLERFWAIHDPREGAAWFGAIFARQDVAQVDPAVRAHALRAYGGAMDMAGDDDAAERLWGEGLALFRALGDENGEAVLLHRLAISAQRRGDLRAARRLARASHRIHERTGNRWGLAQTFGTLGAIARDAGHGIRASELLEESLRLAREAGVGWWVSGTLAELADLDVGAGRFDVAANRARESLTIADGMGDRAGRLFGVGLLAWLAAEAGRHDVAERLWLAIEGEDAGAPLGGWRRHREAYRERIRSLLPAEGSVLEDEPLSLDEAVAVALESAPG